MISKLLSDKLFKEAIAVGFEGDDDIYDLYCPGISVNAVSDIVNDIFDRIKSDVREIIIKGVFDKNKLIGYYAYSQRTLVSFALNIQYRKRKHLQEFWETIRKDLRGGFQAFMWTRNQRGIKWLQKNDMKIVATDNLLTHLIF